MHIETPNLILRPLRESDANAFAQATDETWYDLSQWMRWATDRAKFTDPVTTQLYGANSEAAFLTSRNFIFAGILKATNDFVLTLRLSPLPDISSKFEFGGCCCRKKY